MIRNRMLIFILLFASMGASTHLGAAEKPPIWIIAHMTNSVEAVEWAAGSGANGVETDLQFDDDGNPTVFKHGGACDCTCVNYGVCRKLGKPPCETATPPEMLLKTIAANHGKLGLVFIDSKVGRKNLKRKAAGKKVIGLLDTALFSNREFKGVAIVSVSEREDSDYLEAAAEAAKQGPNAARIYFAFDGRNKVSRVLAALKALPSANVAYGTGISACTWGNYESEIRTAAAEEKKGVISFVYIWTLDKPSSASAYLLAGANGVITNAPVAMIEQLTTDGYKLATPGTPLPPAKPK